MNATPRQRRRIAQWLGYLVGVAITALVGWMLLQDSNRFRKDGKNSAGNVVHRMLLPVADWFSGMSYDLPFLASDERVPEGFVLVLIDNAVKANLGQPTDVPLDRRLHAKFLDRLTTEGARLVVYDLVFDQAADGGTDLEFGNAIRRNGRVVLAGEYLRQDQVGAQSDVIIPPIAVLAKMAADWGPATILPDPDSAIRKLDTGLEDQPSLAWVSAAALDAPVTRTPHNRLLPRWLNYYCAPDSLDAVNLDHALKPDGLPPGYFRNKIVLVGARPSVAPAGANREEYPSPFSHFGGRYASGPAVHLFSLVNLVRGDWLNRVAPTREMALVFFWALFISAVLLRLRPWVATMAAALGAVLFAMTAFYMQARHQVWFAWMVPVTAQTATALVWCISFQYTVQGRRQRQLRRAFSAYLSPYMADQIANSDFDLSLGGKEIEATVMFADLEGFTKISETLSPAEVSRMLTAYFNRITHLLLQQNGTIIKYLGDGLEAAWGAPMPEANHAERAVLAGLSVIQAGKDEVEGRRLRTRIGINTGLVLAGNLGSDFRFDYAVIGDTTNFASRLEGLNKYFGTNLLISEFTQRQLSTDIKLRPLGKFVVVGKAQPVAVYEVLGRAENFTPEPVWLSSFSRALEKFIQREFDDAERLLRLVIEQRGGKDGPAQFYLEEIRKSRAHPSDSWDGIVRLESK